MKYFITFGNGVFENQRKRLIQQAIDSNWFDYVIEETPDTINEFHNQHKSFIDNNKRGYGYWIWKPYIILRQLQKMNDGDFLFYTDAGASIVPHRKYRLDEYVELLKNNNKPILTFGVGHYCEKTFQKMRVLKHFSIDGKKLFENEQFLNSGQVESGVFICMKTDYTITFVEKWLNLLLSNNYELVTDEDDNEQLDSFSDHRHDQSILSILCKTENTIILNDTGDAYGLGPFFSSRLADDGPREFAPDSFRMDPRYDCSKHFTWIEWYNDTSK